jgi:ATP-independent RNA helicase DbpA
MSDNMLFSAVDIPQAQLDNLSDLGYEKMTPIQAKSLPLALAGKDLIAKAKTGSGKTAAFGIPLLNKLNPRFFGAQALVMCPTRELASQVCAELRKLARFQQNIKIVSLCGGQSIGPQIASLEHGAHVIVGTPGRLKDHLRKNTLDISQINTLVLDEADRMLEMGFIDDITAIVEQSPRTRQTLLFSATYPKDIQSLSKQFQQSPVEVSVESFHTEQAIEQRFYCCDKREKLNDLLKVLNHFQPTSAVIFCNTKQVVRDVCDFLTEMGVSAAEIHGDLEQRDRDQVLTLFKQQSMSFLVATDVAARGLDIDDLPAVINYDLPRDPEVYVHRIGRTGRAGKEGLAVSLFAESEKYKVADIGLYQDRELETETLKSQNWSDKPLSPPRFVSLCISGGRKHKVRPGDVLGALTGDAGIEGKAVGKIHVLDFVTFVAIERSFADKALGRLLNGKIKGRKFKVRKA